MGILFIILNLLNYSVRFIYPFYIVVWYDARLCRELYQKCFT